MAFGGCVQNDGKESPRRFFLSHSRHPPVPKKTLLEYRNVL